MATKRTAKTASPAAFAPDAKVVRTCAADGTSSHGFRWPLEPGAMVEAPDWEPTEECGNGLHGLIDGIGDWGLVDHGPGRVWQVVEVMRAECIDLDGKVKFPRGRILYTGHLAGAMMLVQAETVAAIQAAAKEKIATGDSGHAAATGDRGHAAATGDSGHAAATGDRGHAAATGDSGHAAATGYRGHAAATGAHAVAASIGPNGTAKAGPDGWIVLAAWKWSDAAERYELLQVRTAKVGGPEGIKAGVTYCLSEAGKFEEVG